MPPVRGAADWDGRPPCDGWHWLRRRRDGAVRIALYKDGDDWRVADAIGRTVIRRVDTVGRLFVHVRPIPTPTDLGGPCRV